MPKNSNSNKFLEYISLGSEIAVAFSVPILAGYWIDSAFETGPWFLLAGILLGITLMLAIFLRIIRDTGSGE